jgi:chromosome segregation ATPase
MELSPEAFALKTELASLGVAVSKARGELAAVSAERDAKLAARDAEIETACSSARAVLAELDAQIAETRLTLADAAKEAEGLVAESRALLAAVVERDGKDAAWLGAAVKALSLFREDCEKVRDGNRETLRAVRSEREAVSAERSRLASEKRDVDRRRSSLRDAMAAMEVLKKKYPA